VTLVALGLRGRTVREDYLPLPSQIQNPVGDNSQAWEVAEVPAARHTRIFATGFEGPGRVLSGVLGGPRARVA